MNIPISLTTDVLEIVSDDSTVYFTAAIYE